MPHPRIADQERPGRHENPLPGQARREVLHAGITELGCEYGNGTPGFGGDLHLAVAGPQFVALLFQQREVAEQVGARPDLERPVVFAEVDEGDVQLVHVRRHGDRDTGEEFLAVAVNRLVFRAWHRGIRGEVAADEIGAQQPFEEIDDHGVANQVRIRERALDRERYPALALLSAVVADLGDVAPEDLHERAVQFLHPRRVQHALEDDVPGYPQLSDRFLEVLVTELPAGDLLRIQLHADRLPHPGLAPEQP